ncbi:MAG TPA: hypothetical protein DD417_04835 [Elusimicrobia bacterium]|nr:hypothetical protein [Elusimicrobiota bacterium]
MLAAALSSGSLRAMVWTAAALGCLHTVLGPDHYLPFVMLARAEKWSRPRTAAVTFLCGLGHVGSSVVIGAALAGMGMAVSGWSGSRWAELHGLRGAIAAWALMGLGAAYGVWGLVRARRGLPHRHPHLHEDGMAHVHEHGHAAEHLHPHRAGGKTWSPWVLFIVFVFGPCESLIPLMLASWAAAGWAGIVLTTAAFSVTTVATIMAVTGLLLVGVGRIPLGPLDRYAHAAAGGSLALCGAAILCLGL